MGVRICGNDNEGSVGGDCASIMALRSRLKCRLDQCDSRVQQINNLDVTFAELDLAVALLQQTTLHQASVAEDTSGGSTRTKGNSDDNLVEASLLVKSSCRVLAKWAASVAYQDNRLFRLGFGRWYMYVHSATSSCLLPTRARSTNP